MPHLDFFDSLVGSKRLRPLPGHRFSDDCAIPVSTIVRSSPERKQGLPMDISYLEAEIFISIQPADCVLEGDLILR